MNFCRLLAYRLKLYTSRKGLRQLVVAQVYCFQIDQRSPEDGNLPSEAILMEVQSLHSSHSTQLTTSNIVNLVNSSVLGLSC